MCGLSVKVVRCFDNSCAAFRQKFAVFRHDMCGGVAVFGRCFAFFPGDVCCFSLLCLLFFVVMFVVFRCGVCRFSL